MFADVVFVVVLALGSLAVAAVDVAVAAVAVAGTVTPLLRSIVFLTFFRFFLLFF